MLSGTWRRSVGHQQPSATPAAATRGMTVCGVPSGTVVLEAQYDYTYRGADGRQVCIREGERFVLLRKTNADWWQVRRIGAASKTKPLYVPATYVTEVPIKPSPSPQRLVMSASLNSNLRVLPSVSLSPSPSESTYNKRRQASKPIYRSMENLNSGSAFQGLHQNGPGTGGGNYPTLPLSGFTFAPSSSTSLSGHLMVPGAPGGTAGQAVPPNPRVVPMITRSQSSSNLPENLMENPYDEVGGGFSRRVSHRAPKKSCSQWDMVAPSSKSNHLQVPTESYLSQLSWQDSPLYAESGQPDKNALQPEPPCPAPGQQPRQIRDLWEQYSVPDTGRLYYVNTITKERSWKPPRRARGGNNEASPVQPQTLPRQTSLTLQLSKAGNGSTQRLSQDFLFGSHQRNTDRGWQMKQVNLASTETLAIARGHLMPVTFTFTLQRKMEKREKRVIDKHILCHRTALALFAVLTLSLH